MEQEMHKLKNRTALVTGASSGIGKAIAEMLFREGCTVYGIGRDFSKGKPLFHPIEMNLLDTESLKATLKKLNQKNSISILVNAAGVGYYGLHEELSDKKIQEILRTNLEVPMLLTNWLLRSMKSGGGDIVNISSVTAEEVNAHGAAYGAAKSGLTSFTRSVFQEARKHGVRVFNIEPDMTDTNLYRNANFEADTSDERAFLKPEDVAEAVLFALSQREGVVCTDIRLTPELKRVKRK